MLAGPYATMMLADLGAEVTKIEPPTGDISRQVSDSYFASLNRGKRSVCLELATEDGRRQLGALVAQSHALLVNLKPSAIHKLGLTYDVAARVQRQDRLCRAHRLRAPRRRRPGLRLRRAGRHRDRRTDRRPGRPAHASGLLVGGQLHRIDCRAGAFGADHLGPWRAGRCVPARCAALAAELPRVGLPQRRCAAAAAAERRALVLCSRATVSDRRRLPGVVRHPRRVLANLRHRGRYRGLCDHGRTCGAAGRSAGRRLGGAGDRYRRRVGGQAQAAGNPCGRGAHAARGVGCATRDRGVGGAVPARGQQHPRRRLPARLPPAAHPGRARSPHPAQTDVSAQKSE